MPGIMWVKRKRARASGRVDVSRTDHYRSLIGGETTFGKALVQSVYRVSQGAGVAVTTARYYTPSGRLIQRPWDGTFDEYLTYTLREQDPNKAHKADDLKFTDGGRKVYSGGGVEPDRRFDGPVNGFSPNRFSRTIYARNLFDTYAQKFTKKGDTRIAASASSTPREHAPDFVVTDAMLAEFKDLLQKSKVKIDEAAWQQDLPFIRAMIRYEIDLDLFGVEAARKNLSKADPQLQFSMTLFPEAEALMRLGGPAPDRRAAR